MKIGVLFNCQHAGLRRSLQALLPDCEVISFGTPDLDRNPASRPATLQALRGCEIVIWIGTLARRGALDPSLLDGHVQRVLPLPPVIFGGFHPDTCYGGKSLRGPTSAIQSRIAIAAYLAGLNVDDTAALYNRLCFTRLGYDSAFSIQRTLLLESFRQHGLDIAPEFDRWLAAGCFMHSLNHPKIQPLFGIARLACDMLGLRPDPYASLPQDDLANKPAHPVYPDLADMIGVTAETMFRKPRVPDRDAQFLGLERYLALSFQEFAKQPRRILAGVDGVRNAMESLHLA